jgi:hypothetical protein
MEPPETVTLSIDGLPFKAPSLDKVLSQTPFHVMAKDSLNTNFISLNSCLPLSIDFDGMFHPILTHIVSFPHSRLWKSKLCKSN